MFKGYQMFRYITTSSTSIPKVCEIYSNFNAEFIIHNLKIMIAEID